MLGRVVTDSQLRDNMDNIDNRKKMQMNLEDNTVDRVLVETVPGPCCRSSTHTTAEQEIKVDGASMIRSQNCLLTLPT